MGSFSLSPQIFSKLGMTSKIWYSNRLSVPLLITQTKSKVFSEEKHAEVWLSTKVKCMHGNRIDDYEKDG